MVKAIRMHSTGGSDVLHWEDVNVPDPGPGEIRIRQTAIGLNFVDTYHRSGLYPVDLPCVIGSEAVGVVEAIGPGVTDAEVGRRVAYVGILGAYAENRLLRAERAIPLPDEIGDRQAAAMMLKGMTVQYLIRQIYDVKAGDTILVHAAAGGVGLILCQWAKHLGATVIGTVGSDDKAALAKANGCDHPIVYTREDFKKRVVEITGGRKLPVVFDGVGKAVFDDSLDCLRPRGLMVNFGTASGAVPPLAPIVLSQKGSLFLTRPTLAHYTITRQELLACANDLFAVVRDGHVKVEIGQEFRLRDARAAHEALEGRRTTGSTILLP